MGHFVLAFLGFICYIVYMIKNETKIHIALLESRVESIHQAIAKMREDATPATNETVEMAIEMLALPELVKVEEELSDLYMKNLDHFYGGGFPACE